MDFKKKLAALLRCFPVLFGLLSVGTDVAGQQAATAEDLYRQARTAAFDAKDNSKALSLAHRAVALSPGYFEIYIFLGRLYSWNKNVDSARYYFNKALAGEPRLEDAYNAYADLEFWSGNNVASLQRVNQGLSYFPSSTSLLLRKARLLNQAKRFQEAGQVVDTLLRLDRNNTEVRALAERIRDNISMNRVGIMMDYVYFDKQFPDPWLLGAVDYTRQTKAGAFTGRINYANRFGSSGLQFELEAYPRISKTFYAYVNLGWSDASGIFPGWKGGLSLYTNLPRAFELELGMRYLYFSDPTYIYTAYLGKYLGSFLLGARTYLTPASNDIAQSYNVLARYYYGGVDNFAGVLLGAGLSPDSRLTNVQLSEGYARLSTYRAELSWRHAITRLNILTVTISLLNQEYLKNITGNQFQAGLGYIRRF